MQAVRVTRFGEPSALEYVTDVPEPRPGPGEVAVDVTHSAVGLVDLLFRRGRFASTPGMPTPPFIPGLEVAGTVRALGAGVSGLEVGEPVVALSAGTGTGGYASVYVVQRSRVVSTSGYAIDPALAVSVVPNAAMAYVALTDVAHLRAGERVLVHGALGGFAAAFPGVARQLGASRIVGTVRPSRLTAAATSRLPYDRIVESTDLLSSIGDERFDVVVDPVGGQLRSDSLGLLEPGGRLIAAGNAADDWDHHIDGNQLWLGSIAVAGFNAGALLQARPEALRPALAAALDAAASGLLDIDVDELPFSEAVSAHERMEDRALMGRIVLHPDRLDDRPAG